MALLKKFIQTKMHFDGYLEITDAYWRVEKVMATKARAVCTVSINKKDNDSFFRIDEKNYDFLPNLDGGNFIQQAYFHLKTLPEFAGATDC